MQGGEGRLNVVHLTAAQVSNTGAGSTASAPVTRHLITTQASNAGAGGTAPAPVTRLPPMHPTTTVRAPAAAHPSKSAARDTSHNTTVSAPTIAVPQSSTTNGQYNITTQSHAPQVNTVGREYVQYNIASQSSTPVMSSTSSINSPRPLPQNISTSQPGRETFDTTMEEHHQPAAVKDTTSSSTFRKRSRTLEESVFLREGLSNKREEKVKRYQIDIMMQNVHAQIEQALARGDKGKGTTTRLAITESFQELGLEICQLMNSNANLQEENRAAQRQIVQLQNQLLTSTNKSYMGALLQPASATPPINQLSNPIHIPAPVKHAPADKIIIFRAEQKGEKLTKEQQKKFRIDVRAILGEHLMRNIEVIRPTRNGGHILIFQTSAGREEALLVFRNNEINMNISAEQSCIMAPNKRFAKVVCRDPPDDASPDEVMEDLYGKCNMYLSMIQEDQREAKITTTRFGWIFDLSSHEAAAIHAQGNRIRYGLAMEIVVEEYIPIQQCYNCCMYGHSAKYCQMEQSYCRLCGDVGHAGWDCPHKENKAVWKCANCIITNETKGTRYPINHAAAQLHKCPCAQSHKSIRKAQLSAEGIFTYPEFERFRVFENNEEPATVNMQFSGSKSQRDGGSRNNRSRSKLQNKMARNQNNRIPSATASSTIMGSSSSSSAPRPSLFPGNTGTQAKQSYIARTTKPQRPRSFDAWKSGGRTNNQSNDTEELRGRDFVYQSQGTNSVMTTQMSECEAQRPMQMMSPRFNG